MSTPPFIDKETPALEIIRTFDAPLDLVWKAHTETNHLIHWWGPKGYKLIAATLDLRPGGSFHYGLETPQGAELWGKLTYHEVVPQERLVFSVSFSDREGNIVSNPMMPVWPLEIMNTVTFREHNGKTTITVKGYPVNASAQEVAIYTSSHDGIRAGFKGSYDEFEAYLATL